MCIIFDGNLIISVYAPRFFLQIDAFHISTPISVKCFFFNLPVFKVSISFACFTNRINFVQVTFNCITMQGR